jgi:hypothetical protein
MARDLAVIEGEIEKVAAELCTVQSKETREQIESDVVSYLAAARGAALAQAVSPESIASVSGPADFERACALAAYVTLCGPGAREVTAALVRPMLANAPDAKTKAKAASGLPGKLDRLRHEARDAELAQARAEIDRRAAAYAAEENAARNAA